MRGFGSFVLGADGGLVTFLQPAIPIECVGGSDALTRYQPGTFWWWQFVPSFALIAAGLLTSVLGRTEAFKTASRSGSTVRYDQKDEANSNKQGMQIEGMGMPLFQPELTTAVGFPNDVGCKGLCFFGCRGT